MKILFAPIAKGNPYQNQLKLHLEKLGAKVTFVEDNRPRTLLRMAVLGPRFDVLHLHWTNSYTLDGSFVFSLVKTLIFLSSLQVMALRGTQVVWTVHNLSEHERRHAGFEAWLLRRLSKFCGRIIVHNEYCRDEAVRLWQDAVHDKYRVIPHGNYIDAYPNEMSKELSRNTLGLPHDKKMFLCFGLIRRYKGLEKVIEAFASDELQDSILLIAGRPLDNGIKNQLQQKVQGHHNIRLFLEHIPDENVQLFMKACDAVIFSFTDIFTSGSVVLAMSFGKPVISPDLPSLRPFVEDGGAVTYSNGNVKSLVNVILGLKDAEMISFGKKNKDLALRYGWDSIANSTLEVYEQIKK